MPYVSTTPPAANHLLSHHLILFHFLPLPGTVSRPQNTYMNATKPKTKPETAKKAVNESQESFLELSSLQQNMPFWLRALALFGDSTTALIMSFLLFLTSIGVAMYVDRSSTISGTLQELGLITTATKQHELRTLGPIPTWVKTTAPVLEWKDDDPDFLKSLKETFDQDGVVALRGILDVDLLETLDRASSRLITQQFVQSKGKPKGPLTGRPHQPQGTQFFTVKEGAIFLGLNVTRGGDEVREDEAAKHIDLAFLNVALQSKIPRIISQHLLQLPSNETLRMMRDIFLAKDTNEYVCGWHVDDTGFWPADADAPGVNAWIALDDMPMEGGGGFALAVGSHTADWRYDAYQVTGSTHTFPPEGFSSARDTVERRVGDGTCNIATAAPHLHQRMEDTKRMYDVQRGDVIFHTRWLFHRTVPFERTIDAERQKDEEVPLVYRRYSVRYGPGSSRIPRGYGTEFSVLWDAANGGRTADEVAEHDAPWYPQAWPPALETERAQLELIATERLRKVTTMADSRRQQLRRARRAKLYTQPH
jgi:Phytanoyl-CoA dioxygenase (PhyH)